MTLNELNAAMQLALASGYGERPVVVVGHGRLALVTRGYAEDSSGVVVLCIEEPGEPVGVDQPIGDGLMPVASEAVTR